jgi:acyl carrier protein
MEKLNSILCEVLSLSAGDLSDNLAMVDVEGWDSLSHMDLIASIEEEMSIELSADDIMIMTSIGVVRTIVQKKLN